MTLRNFLLSTLGKNTPKSTNKRGVNRRATQNKTPNARMRSKASMGLKAQSTTWNCASMTYPRVSRKQTDNIIYRFSQKQNLGVILTSSTTVPAATALTFSASSNIVQFSSYAALFDQYRIDEIEIWVTPVSTTTSTAGMFYTAVDYDSSSTLTPASISQYSNVLETPAPLHGHYHKFQPHVAVGAYGGSTFTQYKNEISDWIDSNSSSVVHYGLQIVSDTTPGVAVQYEATLLVHFSTRNVI